MAFLVVYKRGCQKVDWSDKAIYLESEFYFEVFNKYKDTFFKRDILSKIAVLGYGDEFEMDTDCLKKLEVELNEISCSQANEFKELVRDTIVKGVHLVISGDMYPTLR